MNCMDFKVVPIEIVTEEASSDLSDDESNNWFATHANFSQVLTNPFVYKYALMIENPRQDFYKSTYSLIKASYDDKLELFMNKDVEETT